MELHQQAASVCNKESLAEFVAALRRDLEKNPSQWENVTLNQFLVAMESWIGDMDQYYKNTGQEPPCNPTWKTFADILCASRIYE